VRVYKIRVYKFSPILGTVYDLFNFTFSCVILLATYYITLEKLQLSNV